jgi:hypothetical protein
MADELLLDFDPMSGMKEWISTDEDTGQIRVRYEQDISATLDDNRTAEAEGFDRRSDFWHAAKIPNIVIMEWAVKHGVQFWNPAHQDGVKRLLNDPEYKHLRRARFQI